MPKIYIAGFGSLSALGSSRGEIIASYRCGGSQASTFELAGRYHPIFRISPSAEHEVESELQAGKRRHIARVTLLALLAARKALARAHWEIEGNDFNSTGVSIGSARGATQSLELLHKEFLEHAESRTHAYASILTTAGGISNAIAAEQLLTGPAISTSMTCTSFLHSALVAIGLLRSGMFKRFLVGGSEAPITSFGIAQMQALRIYSQDTGPYPCRPCASERSSPNSLVLGEGAAVFCLTTDKASVPAERPPQILGIGWSRESLRSETGMDPTGSGLRESMQRALHAAGLNSVDAVILHAPGTALGDSAEIAAITALWERTPHLFSTKYLTGHTFGASAALSLELALLILEGAVRPRFPYKTPFNSPEFNETDEAHEIRTCLINSAGFGGSTMSLVVGFIN